MTRRHGYLLLITQEIYYTLSILPPYTWEEKVDNFVNSFITPLNAVSTFIIGIGTALATIWLYFLKKKLDNTCFLHIYAKFITETANPSSSYI